MLFSFCCDLHFHWPIQDLSRFEHSDLNENDLQSFTCREACKLNLRQGDTLISESTNESLPRLKAIQNIFNNFSAFLFMQDRMLWNTFSNIFLWKYLLLFEYCYQRYYYKGIGWEEDKIVQQGRNMCFFFYEHLERY